MSTADLAPQPTPSAGLVPAPPPVPARSRLRGPPSNGNINGSSKQGSPSRTPRTPITQLPSSPSDSSISSSSSASAAAGSPGVPITPATPSFTSLADAAPTLPTGVSHTKYGSMGRSEGGPAWPGKLEQSPTSPAHGATADRRRSRFGRGRHSSSSSVTLRASADPMRIKDGVAPRGSSSGVYTPPTFPGPSPRPSMHSHNPSFASSVNMGPTMRSASGSSESSSTSSNFSIPQTPTSPSAAASRMYSACIGALSVWSISSGSGSSKRASNPAKPISGPVGSPVHVESGPMSAAAAYFPGSSRNSSFSQLHPKHQTSRSVSYTSAHSSEQYTPVQVWSPENGWTSAAGLGVGVEEEGNYAQGLTRSSTSSTPQLGPAVIMADAPKGRRKPVPRVEGESQEVHAL